MRLAVYLSGTLGLMLFAMGYLFKMMHWPMAHYMLTIGLSLIGLIAIPLSAYYKYQKGKVEKDKRNEDVLDDSIN